jgi:hypothetical protein
MGLEHRVEADWIKVEAAAWRAANADDNEMFKKIRGATPGDSDARDGSTGESIPPLPAEGMRETRTILERDYPLDAGAAPPGIGSVE